MTLNISAMTGEVRKILHTDTGSEGVPATQGASQVDRSTLVIPVGYALMAVSFVVLLVAASTGPLVSPLWLIGSIVLSTLSELAAVVYLLPSVLSALSRSAPPRSVSVAATS